VDDDDDADFGDCTGEAPSRFFSRDKRLWCSFTCKHASTRAHQGIRGGNNYNKEAHESVNSLSSIFCLARIKLREREIKEIAQTNSAFESMN